MQTHGIEEEGYSPQSADGGGVVVVPGEDPEGVQAFALGGDVVGVALHGGEDTEYVCCCVVVGLLLLWLLLLLGGSSGGSGELVGLWLSLVFIGG